jgi:hypothetical protein
MAETWLVMADVDAVQSYLFASLHLREAAGASALLVDHDAAVAKIAEAVDPRADVLFSAGGSALVAFTDRDAADRFAPALRRSLASQAPGATVSFGGPCSTASGFPAARDAAARDLERNKRLGADPGEATDCALALRCEGCGREPARAGARVQVGTDARWLGVACLRKHEARERGAWLDLMRGQHGWRGIQPSRLARDTTDLAGEELLGIVVADADGAGDRLRAIGDAASYRAFSTALADAVRGALVASIAGRCDPRAPGCLPVDVLYAGGDDVVAAVRGDLALPFARSLVEGFGAAIGAKGSAMGMSAAVALVGPTFPFRLAHDLAADLLREAKREARARRWSEGAIDWAVVTESHADARAILADRAVRVAATGDALLLTGRPYRAAASGPRSVGGFADACRKLAAAEFPRNKLFALRALCSAGELHGAGPATSAPEVDKAKSALEERFGTWHARAKRAAAAAWSDACRALDVREDAPWWDEDRERRTPVGDLAEGVGLWRTA